ncbi:MAG TPA: hypothetical protein VM779_15525 [Thermoanaerobaculia bacterium]|nr:hypothetical protein [Thermoanaerobaculia bacterium]
MASILSAQQKETPLAKAQGDRDGTRLEVTDLRRGDDGAVTLRMRVYNDHADGAIGACDLADSRHKVADFDTVGGAHLLDYDSRTKYGVDRRANRKCICSQGVRINPGTKRNVWAKFTIPDDVEKVTVVVPTFEPVDLTIRPVETADD